LKNSEEIDEVIYFASSRQQDILALDALYRIFPKQSLSVTLASMPTKKRPNGDTEALANLLDYCKQNYPAYKFKSVSLTYSDVVEQFDRLNEKAKIDLVVVPTPHKNIFSRLFNPTLAHKLIFHADIPMLSIPV
ncbi:MAG: universal stress protein, partial [Muribaculum sp.]|nr:universal stress protein [Muribaculum sp.]